MTQSSLRVPPGTATRLLMASLAAVFWIALSAGVASAQEVPSGTDCWETDPGTKAGIPPLPADFFHPGSDPFPGASIDVVGVPLEGAELADCGCEVAPGTDVVWVDIHGDPVAPDSVHRVTQIPPGAVDTCVKRLTPTPFPGGVGVPEPVAVEIVQLHLRSIAPITVTGTAGPTLWDVTITEDGVQVAGQLTLTPSTLVPAPAGAMVLDGLPVNFQIQFQQVGGPPVGTGTAGLGGLSLNFGNTNGNFQVNPLVPTMGPLGPLAVGIVIVCGFAWLVRRRIQAA